MGRRASQLPRGVVSNEAAPSSEAVINIGISRRALCIAVSSWSSRRPGEQRVGPWAGPAGRDVRIGMKWGWLVSDFIERSFLWIQCLPDIRPWFACFAGRSRHGRRGHQPPSSCPAHGAPLELDHAWIFPSLFLLLTGLSRWSSDKPRFKEVHFCKELRRRPQGFHGMWERTVVVN